MMDLTEHYTITGAPILKLPHFEDVCSVCVFGVGRGFEMSDIGVMTEIS